MFCNLWMVVQNDMCKRIFFRCSFPFFFVRYNSTKTHPPQTLYEKHKHCMKSMRICWSFTVFFFYSMYLLNFKEYTYTTVLDRLRLILILNLQIFYSMVSAPLKCSCNIPLLNTQVPNAVHPALISFPQFGC